MPLHAIVLTEENNQVVKRIEKHYPRFYSVNEKAFLVRTEDISEQVAVKVGIKGDDRIDEVLGAVFRLNGAHAGYAARSLWEWLEPEEEK